jgi:NADH-quinone oxidoreductase subunit M
VSKNSFILLFTSNKNNARIGHWIALLTTIVSLALCILLWYLFDNSTYQFQFQEIHPWITAYGINYALGVDGISLPMVILTTITTLVVILASWRLVTENATQYLATFLIVQGMMVGVFCALDSVLFYVFWEGMLIPIYLNIGIWGGERRVYASMKFFIYTFAGSALMLVAILFLGIEAKTFMITDFYALPLSEHVQMLVFIAFLIAFAVKIPLWPVHTWLPDAHTEAPAGGSVVLAALMLKLGVYGFLRFNLPITPDASKEMTIFMIVLALIAIVYIGLIAIVQKDMKRLIAYSSIAHMGFVTLGFFLFSPLGIEGGIVQMISHGFVAGAMFLSIGVLYDRMHTRQIADYGGVVHRMPAFTAFAVLMAMANCGLPATSGFVGEFMVILAAVDYDFVIGILAATALILSAAYSLWMVKRVFFGAITNQHVEELKDLNAREYFMMAVLSICVIGMGVYPKPFTDIIHPAVINLLQHVAVSKL